MGIRFSKSINLGKGVKLNISKSGVGVSVGKTIGKTSVRVGRTAKGKTRVTGTLKGTGVSYVKEFTDPVTQAVKDKQKEQKRAKKAEAKKETPVERVEAPVVEEQSGPMTTSQRIAARKAAQEQAKMEPVQEIQEESELTVGAHVISLEEETGE